MSAAFPSGIYAQINVSGTTLTNNPAADHAGKHNDIGTEIVAIEQTLGTNLTGGTYHNINLDYIRGSTSGTAAFFTVLGTPTANYVELVGNKTGSSPQVNPTGTDANVGLDMTMQGTGAFRVFGTTIVLAGTTNNLIANDPILITPVVKTEVSNGNFGTGNGTVNWANGDRQFGTVNSANGTIVFSGAVAGQVLSLWIYEDATGTRPINIPTIKWPGTTAPTFATAASNVNSMVVRFDGNNYYGNFSTGYG